MNTTNFADSGVLEVLNQHPDAPFVDRFAFHMKSKLMMARKFGKERWQDPAWTSDQISRSLREHVERGDPVDVANYCMFLSARRESIAGMASSSEQVERIMSLADAMVRASCTDHATRQSNMLPKARAALHDALTTMVVQQAS